MPQATELPADFDPAVYYELNPDVKAAGVDAKQHYLEYGKKENRRYKYDRAGNSSGDFESTLAEFLTEKPSDQNAFDLFPKYWSTVFKGVETKGSANLSDDDRIKWLLSRVSVSDKKILELGPLEGGHTFMLEKAGASILSIEANKGAFLRCLIVKNYLQLKSKFLLGDFEKLDLEGKRFDLVLASGVLYHMREPIDLLKTLSKVTDSIFLWTHYFEPDLSLWNRSLAGQLNSGKWDLNSPVVINVDGLQVKTIKQSYREALDWSGFCGGTDTYSNWVYREDLLSVLKLFGFHKLEISFDHVSHPNGPAFCVLAQK